MCVYELSREICYTGNIYMLYLMAIEGNGVYCIIIL